MLINRHILLWVNQGMSVRSKLPFRWPWSHSPRVFQEIISQMYFHSDHWVGIATQEVDSTLVAECLLHRGYFFKEAKKNTPLPRSPSQVFATTRRRTWLAHRLLQSTWQKKIMLICYFCGHVNLMATKKEMKRALPSKCSRNQWLSQWQEGRTTARGGFA